MFKVKLTILLINFLVVSTICDDSIIESVEKENKEDEKVCPSENAVPDYLREQLNVVDFIGMCVDHVLNTTSLKIEIDEAATEENVNEIIKNACLQKDLIYNCVEKNYIEPIDECKKGKDRNLIDSQLLQSRDLLTHFCFDDGLRIRNFFNDNSSACFVEKSDTLRNCSRTLYEQLNSNETIEEKCGYMKAAYTCSVEVLQSCEKQGAAIFTDEFLHIVVDEHICKDIL